MQIFTNITQYSGFHFSFTERRWVPADIAYSWGKYSEDIESVLPFGGGNYYRYSDLKSTAILFGDCLFFMVLTYYFDHVVASNRGRSEPPYFPLNRIFGCLFSKCSSKQEERHLVQDPDAQEYSPYALQ
jgi:hypothetical protein